MRRRRLARFHDREKKANHADAARRQGPVSRRERPRAGPEDDGLEPTPPTSKPAPPAKDVPATEPAAKSAAAATKAPEAPATPAAPVAKPATTAVPPAKEVPAAHEAPAAPAATPANAVPPAFAAPAAKPAPPAKPIATPEEAAAWAARIPIQKRPPPPGEELPQQGADKTENVAGSTVE